MTRSVLFKKLRPFSQRAGTPLRLVAAEGAAERVTSPRAEPSLPRPSAYVVPHPHLAQAVEDAPRLTKPLTCYIRQRFHDSHRSDLAELIRLCLQIAARSGDDGQTFARILAVLTVINMQLAARMEEDETFLFPMMVSAACPKLTLLIRRSMTEHRALRDRLEELRNLIQHADAPTAAGPDWRALCVGAQDFADDLVAHLHLKDAVLFPRFL